MISASHIRWVIIASLVVIIGSTVFFILRPIGVGVSVGKISVVGTDADLKMDRVHVVQNKQGKKSWELWADTAKVYRKKDSTQMENIHLRFYSKNGKIMDVTADQGQMENESRNIQLRGNVLIKSQDGVSMQTEALQFQPKEKKIGSKERIFVKGESFQLTGIGLRGRTDLGQYFLEKKVEAVISDTKTVGLNPFSKSAEAAVLSKRDGSLSGEDKP